MMVFFYDSYSRKNTVIGCILINRILNKNGKKSFFSLKNKVKIVIDTFNMRRSHSIVG